MWTGKKQKTKYWWKNIPSHLFQRISGESDSYAIWPHHDFYPSNVPSHYSKKNTLKQIHEIVVIAFDEEERILVVSFLPKSLSRVLWTSAAGIDRDGRRFQRLGAILDWLTGSHSLDLMC